MSRLDRIQQILKSQLAPVSLEVVNESHLHAGPLPRETHFKVVIVSEAFKSKSRVERQRLINDLLAEEFRNGLHALSLRALDPDEPGAQEFAAPLCSHKK